MGALSLEAHLSAQSGEVVGLLGPNAAGKTTLLRALAGLTPLDSGRVSVDGELLEDVAAGTRVPADRRRIGVVFQDYRLFPHLSALDNVAFGLRARGISRRESRGKAAEWLARFGLAEQALLRPRALSGGQAQRVALARALVIEPGLLLLDEPLAALDAGARAELRRELRRHLSTFAGTCVVVTHDPLEAMTLAEQLVVLEDGRVTQSGTPRSGPRTSAFAVCRRARRPQPVPWHGRGRGGRRAAQRQRARPGRPRRRIDRGVRRHPPPGRCSLPDAA